MKKRDTTKALKRNVAIFDYARKHGCAAAAEKYSYSERNIQRIMSRVDVRRAIGTRDAPVWLRKLRRPIEKAQLTALSISAQKWTNPELLLVRKYLTDDELDQLNDVDFTLVHEIALYRHRSKRKRRATPVASKSQRQHLAAK